MKYCGVPAADIIIAKGYGSSTRDRVEIFFAYVGTIPGGTQDLWIENAHHAYASYARQNGIIMPAYQNINQGLDNIALKLASDYPVISFMVKPFHCQHCLARCLLKLQSMERLQICATFRILTNMSYHSKTQLGNSLVHGCIR